MHGPLPMNAPPARPAGAASLRRWRLSAQLAFVAAWIAGLLAILGVHGPIGGAVIVAGAMGFLYYSAVTLLDPAGAGDSFAADWQRIVQQRVPWAPSPTATHRLWYRRAMGTVTALIGLGWFVGGWAIVVGWVSF
jgi:hypothetical protein